MLWPFLFVQVLLIVGHVPHGTNVELPNINLYTDYLDKSYDVNLPFKVKRPKTIGQQG